jgi:hypothetical protein
MTSIRRSPGKVSATAHRPWPSSTGSPATTIANAHHLSVAGQLRQLGRVVWVVAGVRKEPDEELVALQQVLQHGIGVDAVLALAQRPGGGWGPLGGQRRQACRQRAGYPADDVRGAGLVAADEPFDKTERAQCGEPCR